MDASAHTRPPRWYWIAAGLILAWMLVGVAAWLADLMMDEAAFAELSDAQRSLYERRPGWLFRVYGVAVIAGLAGALGLLLRRDWAVLALGLSLAAVVIQMGYTFTAMDAIGALGAAAALPFPLLILGIGAASLWLSLHARRRDWLRR